MQKWQKTAAAAGAVFLIAAGGMAAHLYAGRKATEAFDEAQRAKWESQGQQGRVVGKQEIDYAMYSDNEFDYGRAYSRPQLFKENRILYDGKHYARHTGTKAILILGLDRKGDDLHEKRLPIDQGQTDAIYLLAYNTSRKTVKILQIPRDTMAVMHSIDENGKELGQTVDGLTMAFNSGDGVTLSCERACEATGTMLGGLAIDHYMVGDINVVTDLNDLLGGVTVTVPNDDMERIDPAFVKGARITLHGDQAERFVRGRDTGKDNTALYRMGQHRAYIMGFQRRLKQCLKSDGKIVDRMFSTIENDILTDMKRSEYTELTLSMLSGGEDLKDGDFLMLPGEAKPAQQHGENVYDDYYPHYADINRMVLDLFYYPTD